MSWVEIVHTGMLGSGFITTAAVLSPAGVQFAGTVGFKIIKEDFVAMYKAFHDHTDLFRSGLILNGKKYVAISANPRMIHCKAGPSGIICMRALHCVLVGLYFPPVTAPQAVGTMESVADAINDGVYKTEKDGDPQE